MPPRYTEIGQLVLDDPEAASRRLAALLADTKAASENDKINKSALARRLGVDYATVQRWFRRLREVGHPVELGTKEADSASSGAAKI